jgi:hypothetical protein
MKTNLFKTTGKIAIVLVMIFGIHFSADGQVIARDKQLHIGAGAVVAGWGTLIPQNNKGWKPFIYGVGSATIAGVGKEVTDLGGFGTPDFKDLGATVLGGVVSAGIITGVKAIIRKAVPSRRRFLYAQRPQQQQFIIR